MIILVYEGNKISGKYVFNLPEGYLRFKNEN
jgi:hypothetical protein